MLKYLQRKVVNSYSVKKMTEEKRKKVGGEFILYGTLLLLIPLMCMMLEYHNLFVQIFFQIVWAICMFIGGFIAFDTEKGQKRSMTK